MVERNFEFDAALVHGYWPSQKGDEGLYEQGARGAIITRMAAKEFFRGHIGILVTTNGPVWGNDYPPVGELMVNDWVHKYQIPRERIFAIPQAIPTTDEVALFLEAAKRQRWKNLLDIAFDRHHWTIPHFYPKELNVRYKNVEQMTREIGDIEERRLVERMRNSRYEYAFMAYQLAQKLLLELGLGEFLRRQAVNMRRKKGPGFPIRIDKFDL